jgi:DNA (cytosine-5)-methyltransferase 1
VFVVASARDGFDPATVLFEWEGVRRDSAPRREAGKVAPTIPSRSTGGGGLGTDFDCDGGLIARAVSLRGREGGGTAELGDDVQSCLRASGGGGDKPHVLIHADPIARCDTTGEAKRQDWETCNFVAHCRGVAQTITSNYGKQLDNSDTALGPNVVAHSLRGEGFDASEDGTGRGTPLVPVAFPGNLSGTQCAASVDVAPAMGAKNPTAVSYAIQAGALRTNATSGPNGVGVQADHAYTLEARAEVQAVAFAENSRAEVRLEGGDGSRCGAISTGGGKAGQGVPMIAQTMQVRRLTPTECERLQGFQDDYTRIPWKAGYWSADKHAPEVCAAVAEQCPDGPRYKALGNSWAAPVVRWIGERIQRAVDPT